VFLSLFKHGLFGLSFEFDFLIKVLSPEIVFFQSALEAQKRYIQPSVPHGLLIQPFPSSGKLVQLSPFLFGMKVTGFLTGKFIVLRQMSQKVNFKTCRVVRSLVNVA